MRDRQRRMGGQWKGTSNKVITEARAVWAAILDDSTGARI